MGWNVCCNCIWVMVRGCGSPTTSGLSSCSIGDMVIGCFLARCNGNFTFHDFAFSCKAVTTEPLEQMYKRQWVAHGLPESMFQSWLDTCNAGGNATPISCPTLPAEPAGGNAPSSSSQPAEHAGGNADPSSGQRLALAAVEHAGETATPSPSQCLLMVAEKPAEHAGGNATPSSGQRLALAALEHAGDNAASTSREAMDCPCSPVMVDLQDSEGEEAWPLGDKRWLPEDTAAVYILLM